MRRRGFAVGATAHARAFVAYAELRKVEGEHSGLDAIADQLEGYLANLSDAKFADLEWYFGSPKTEALREART